MRLFSILVDRLTDAPYKLDLRIICSRTARMTTPARPEARLLGSLGNWKKSDLFASRPPCRTGRPAINSGRADCENKAAVARAVTGKHSIPKFRIVHYARYCRCNLKHFTSPLRNLMRR